MTNIIRPTPASMLGSTASPWGASRFSEAQRCEQAHDLAFVQRLRPKKYADPDFGESGGEPSYFALGSLVHACRAWSQLGARDGWAADWREVIQAASEAGTDPGVLWECERLLTAYDAHHGTENAGWPEGVQILEVECLWEAQLGALPYTARADALVRLPDGSLAIPDIKTRAKALPEDAAQHWGLRPQFLGLAWLAMRALKLEVPPPVWVDAIVKTKVPKFARVLVPLDAGAVLRWASNQERVAGELARMQEARRLPIMNYAACAPEIGSPCRWQAWCHGSDELRAQRFEREEPKENIKS